MLADICHENKINPKTTVTCTGMGQVNCHSCVDRRLTGARLSSHERLIMRVEVNPLIRVLLGVLIVAFAIGASPSKSHRQGRIHRASGSLQTALS
jgi:hypothetical protein